MARYQYRRSNKRKFLIILLVGILVGVGIGYYAFSYSQVSPSTSTPIYVYRTAGITSSAEINLAAVDQNGKGVTTPLVVEVKSGDGKILTNIEKLLFWVDTQQSIQTARDVAENITKIDVSNYDLTYTIRSDATLVGGPSAGAALTIATIAALENKTLRSDVMITGTINPDGSIGEVGGILEKAKAAKELGSKVFLVPVGEGEETFLKPEENCIQRGNFLFCETKYIQTTVNIGKEAGISVIEVGNVNDALKYFI